MSASSQPPRVLYMSYDGMTDPLGQSQVIPYLQGLTRKGLQFTLLSCEKPDAYTQHQDRIRQLLTDSGIEWVPTPYRQRPPLVSTLLNVSQLWRTAVALHRKRQFRAVHCRSYITSLVGLGLKRRFGLKFIFDMRGFWPDERVEGNLWNLKNPVYRTVYRFFKRKEQEYLTQADGVVSLTHNGAAQLKAWTKGSRPDLHVDVIPCCVDVSLFSRSRISAEEQARLRAELGIAPDDYVVLYLGSVGTVYLLDDMLRLFPHIQRQRPTAKFLFISPSNPEEILGPARRLGIDTSRIVIRKAIRPEVPALASLASVAVMFFLPTFSRKGSSPTKLAELLSLEIPVISNTKVGDMEYLVQKYGFGILLDQFTDADLAHAASQLDRLEALDKRVLTQAVDEYLNLQSGVETYWAMYQRVLNR